MAITHAVSALLDGTHWPGPRGHRPSRKVGRRRRPDWRVSVTGLLCLDADGARLYDSGDGRSVVLADPEACAALRAALPGPGEYLGDALLEVWVRDAPAGPELHGTYWILLGDMENEPPSRWGPRVEVRPVPPEHDYAR